MEAQALKHEIIKLATQALARFEAAGDDQEELMANLGYMNACREIRGLVDRNEHDSVE